MIQTSDDGNVFLMGGKVYTRTGSASSWTVATGATNVTGILSGNGLVVLESERILEATDQTWSSVTITNTATIGGSMNKANYPTIQQKIIPSGLSVDGKRAILLFFSASANATYRGQLNAGFAVKVNNTWVAGPNTNIAYVDFSNSSVSNGFSELFYGPAQYASSDLSLVAFRWQTYRMNGQTGGYAQSFYESLFGLRTNASDPTGFSLMVGPRTIGSGPGAGDAAYGNFATYVARDGTAIYRSRGSMLGVTTALSRIPVSTSMVLGTEVSMNIASTGLGGYYFNDTFPKVSQLGNLQNGDTSYARNYVDLYVAPPPIDSSNGLILPVRSSTSGVSTGNSLFVQATFNASGAITLRRAGPTTAPAGADAGCGYNGTYIVRSGTFVNATTGDNVRAYKLN